MAWAPDVSAGALITAEHMNAVKNSISTWLGDVNGAAFKLFNIQKVLVGTSSDNNTDLVQVNGSLLATTLKGSLAWSYLTSVPASFTPSTHTHLKAQITDFAVAWSEISSKPTTISGYGITDAITTANIGSQSVNYAASAGAVDWANVSSKPSTFAPSTHTHVKADITDLSLAWSSITGKPTTVSGYGITDAITTANIGSQSVNYAASAGAVAWSNVSSKPTTISGYGITDAPTKTGTGASGTWAIAISGSAAQLNSMASSVSNTGDTIMARNVYGETQIGAIYVIGSSVGYVVVSKGDSTHSGLIEWRKADNTRLGYMGYSNTDIAITLENSAKFLVNGDQTIMGSLTATGSGSGYITVNRGASGTNTGYIEWRKADSTRLGYMGYSNTDVLLTVENSAKFLVAGGAAEFGSTVTATGALISSGSDAREGLKVLSNSGSKFYVVKPETATSTAEVGYWNGSAWGTIIHRGLSIFDSPLRYYTQSSNPTAPSSGDGHVYIKSGKLVVQYNDGGTTKYRYLTLNDTTATWTYTTTAP